MIKQTINKSPIVVNKYKSDYDIYIGRGSKWGNPFVIGKDGSRQEVIKKYSDYLKICLKNKVITIDDLLELNGARLGCYCKPKACHGDVLVRACKWANYKRFGNNMK